MRTAVALLAVVILLMGLALLYLYSGTYNIAATDEHTGVVRWAVSTVKLQSIRSRAKDVDVVVPTDSAALRSGARAFADMCVVCHGAPGEERGWMGQGMNPEPPEMARAAEEFSPEEVFWILKNGIKMAGMPALGPTHSDEEILELVAFVEQLPELSEEEYRAWREQQHSPDDAGAEESGDGHDHDHTH